MPELNAKIFRDYFGGSWVGRITKNGNFQREIVFNWPTPFGKFSSLGTEPGLLVPPDNGILDNSKQVVVSGWRSDIRRWVSIWHNEFGGYGEMQWTSQEMVNGIRVLYGFSHECKQETCDVTNHIVKCEIINKDHFKYTLQSFKMGLTEIEASRIRTAKELNKLLEKQASTMHNFENITV